MVLLDGLVEHSLPPGTQTSAFGCQYFDLCDNWHRLKADVRRRKSAYCGLMFAALMIGHHLSISLFWCIASDSGFSCSTGKTSSPRSERRARSAGSANVCTTVALSLSMIGLGVPLGAQRPCQFEIWNSGNPASSTVGMSGAAVNRLFAVTA